MATLIAYLISFAMAFLLFVVQPMATKAILPQFGGTPAVWNTAMLFFQSLLLFGYIYAHLLTTWLKPRQQMVVHAALVLLGCAVLPMAFMPPAPEAISNAPIRSLIVELLSGVGIPFFCVAATAPLLQRWVSYSNTALAAKPYVLYSASNLGSMSALIGYILLVEPNITLSFQMVGWGVGFAIVSVSLLIFSYLLSGRAEVKLLKDTEWLKVPLRHSLIWIGLAFVPSSLSLGLTTYITTDVASVPFFWVVPFTVYLLSYVDAFANRRILVPIAKYLGPVFALFCMTTMANNQLMRHMAPYIDIRFLHLLAFGFLAFAIHGHLADRKPSVNHLTWYYVCLSIGGALGGVFNAILVPMIFHITIEYLVMFFVAAWVSFLLLRTQDPHFSLRKELGFTASITALVLVIGGALYVGYRVLQDGWDDLLRVQNYSMASMSLCLVVAILSVAFRSVRAFFYAAIAALFILLLTSKLNMSSIVSERNFFGVSRVYEYSSADIRYLQHNTTIHGIQSHDPAHRLEATSYYGGLEEIMAHRLDSVRMEPIGAIGLGIGVVKCQSLPQQHMDIFEINPLVVEIAEDSELFTYLSDCPGKHDIVLGDGRLTMSQMPHAKYGTIIIDAFSSDAIPVHLLTKEAFEMYLDKLQPNGIIAVHVTNRYMDLRTLLAKQAEGTGLVAYTKFFQGDGKLHYPSFWVVMARNDATLLPLLTNTKDWWKVVPEDAAVLWTDDYTNILPYLTRMR